MFTTSFESKQKDSNEETKLVSEKPIDSDVTKTVGKQGKYKNKPSSKEDSEEKQLVDGGNEKNMQRW
jgi:hypothetical protein